MTPPWNNNPNRLHPHPAPVISKADINLLPLKKYEGPVDGHRRRRNGCAWPCPSSLPKRYWALTSRSGRPSRSATIFPRPCCSWPAKTRYFLVQLKKVKHVHVLGALFSDERVIKTGVAVSGDIEKLHEIMDLLRPASSTWAKWRRKRGSRPWACARWRPSSWDSASPRGRNAPTGNVPSWPRPRSCMPPPTPGFAGKYTCFWRKCPISKQNQTKRQCQ